MRQDWDEVIAEAQELVVLQMNGSDYPRIQYGAEPRVGNPPVEPPRVCHDCAVPMGKLHVPTCDMEICPRCGCQILGCDCDIEMQVYRCGCREPVPDGGRT